MMKIGKYRLSLPTLALGIFIIVSAAFMTQVWTLASNIFGDKQLKFACVTGIFIIGIGILLYLSRQKLKFFRLILGAIVLCLGFWYAWRQPYFVKRIHTLEYSILGLLAERDFKKILYAVLLVLAVACLDEGFQALLPYRVGDIPDVITDLLGGSAGILLYIIIKR